MKQMLLNAEKSFNSSINGKGVNKNLFMKKGRYLFPFIILILFGIVNSNSVNAQLLQQQFSTNDGTIFSINGTTTKQALNTGTYFNSSSPSNAQFNYAAAGTGTASNTQTLTSNGSILTWSKAGTSTTGAIFRTTNLAASAPTSLIVKADVATTTVTTGGSNLTFYIGSGFSTYVNSTTAPTVPAAGSTAAKFVIQCTSTGSKWGVSSATTVAANTSTTVTWALNNSGSTLSYLAPNGTYETVANNTYDLWIGTTKDQNDIAYTTTGVALQNFAIALGGGVETFTLDNILIDPIPTAPSISSPTNISATGFTANWGAVTGATGYNLDVSTSSLFASFVSGYNNLGVVGTNTQAVTGLTSVGSGTTYYYRARTYNTYSVATNTSGNNFTAPTLGGVSVSNVCAGNAATVSLTGLVASSTNNIVSYSIGGGATQTATVNADVSGNASFSTPTLVAGNNGQNFVILGIANGSAGIVPGSNNSATLTVYSSSGVTFNISTNPNILQGTTSTNLFYTSSGSPDHYTITYAAGAISAGFSNVANTSNTFTASGTLPIAIPGSAASGIYSGTVTAILASNGCSASAPFTITSYYNWTGTAGDNNWATPGNWSPSRNTPAAGDVLVFDGKTATLTSIPTETDYQVIVKNSSSLSLANGTAATLTISNSLTVDGTSILTESTNASITIASGATATINGTLNVNAGTFTTSAGITTVSGSSALLSNGGGTVTGSATTLFFTSGATYTHAMAAGTIPTANWISSGASLVNITGATSACPSGMGQTFYNLTWNCNNQSANYAFSGTPVINGTLNVIKTGSVSVLLLIPSGTSFSVPTYIQNGGTVAIVNSQGSTGTRTFTVTGNFTIDNMIGTSIFYLNRNAGATGAIGTLEVQGNFNAASGTSLLVSAGSFTPTGTLLLDGTGNQTITAGSATVFATTPSAIGVTVSKASGTLSLSSNLTVPGALSLTNGTLTVGANTLNIQGSTSGSGLIDATNSSANITFNGAAVQTIAAPFTSGTISNLTMNNTSGGVTLSTPITLSGVLTLTSGALTTCLLYTSPSPRDRTRSRMPSSA